MRWIGLLRVIVVLLASQYVYAESQCAVIEPYPNGSFLVSVNEKKMLAITSEMAANAQKLKTELEALQKEIAAKEALLKSLENVEQHYEKMLGQQREYIEQLEITKDGYKDLAKDYKKLSGEPWLTLDVGLGATGGDTDPAILVGVGIRKVKMWGFVQENNSGLVLGTNFTLF